MCLPQQNTQIKQSMSENALNVINKYLSRNNEHIFFSAPTPVTATARWSAPVTWSAPGWTWRPSPPASTTSWPRRTRSSSRASLCWRRWKYGYQKVKGCFENADGCFLSCRASLAHLSLSPWATLQKSSSLPWGPALRRGRWVWSLYCCCCCC